MMLTVEDLERELLSTSRPVPTPAPAPAHAGNKPPLAGGARAGAIEHLYALRRAHAAEKSACPPGLEGLYDRSSAGLVKWHPTHGFESSPPRHATQGTTPPREGIWHSTRASSIGNSPQLGPASGSYEAGGAGSLTSTPSRAAHGSAHGSAAASPPGRMPLLPPSLAAAQGGAAVRVAVVTADESKSASDLEKLLEQMGRSSNGAMPVAGGGGRGLGAHAAHTAGRGGAQAALRTVGGFAPLPAAQLGASQQQQQAGARGQPPAGAARGGDAPSAPAWGAAVPGAPAWGSVAQRAPAQQPQQPALSFGGGGGGGGGGLERWFAGAQPAGGQPAPPPPGEVMMTLEELERQMASGHGV